jgi:hypothetical protein
MVLRLPQKKAVPEGTASQTGRTYAIMPKSDTIARFKVARFG